MRKYRPIVFKLSHYKWKTDISKATFRRLEEGTEIEISEDYTERVRNIRNELMGVFKEGETRGAKSVFEIRQASVDANITFSKI